MTEVAHMQPIPDFVLKQSARCEFLIPEMRGHSPVLRQEFCQCDRTIEIDHLSSRSRLKSSISSSNVMTGLRGGGPECGFFAGVNHPSRTPRERNGSERIYLCAGCGGLSSATT